MTHHIITIRLVNLYVVYNNTTLLLIIYTYQMDIKNVQLNSLNFK